MKRRKKPKASGAARERYPVERRTKLHWADARDERPRNQSLRRRSATVSAGGRF